jgi:peptidoglycan-associated lipoprotein
MAMKKIGLGLAMVLALAACDKNKNGSGGDVPPVGGVGANGTNGISTSNLDPNSAEYFKSEIGDRVLFLVDQSTLTPAGYAVLDKQAEWLIAHPSVVVLIEGHADEQGTREYNLALGARRAAAVQSYLVSKGMADARMRTITYGKEKPLEICSTEACWSKNRRAVTVVTGGFNS